MTGRIKLVVSIFALLVLGGVYLTGSWWQGPGKPKVVPQSHPTYHVDLMSGKSYPVAQPVTLRFNIRDQNNQVFKDYDTSNQYVLMLLTIRKDRTNYQHIHPLYNKQTGLFTWPGYQFPTDGEYRLFATFTPNNAQKGPDGIKLSVASYEDVRAGDLSKYVPQPTTTEKLTSTADGFDANVFFSSDDSLGSPNTSFIAGVLSTVAISINKDGQPFKNLQDYKGSLGRIAVFGPKLEFAVANSVPEDVTKQNGLIIFNLTFPDPGLYRLYFQTQANYVITTNEFIVTVKPNPSSD